MLKYSVEGKGVPFLIRDVYVPVSGTRYSFASIQYKVYHVCVPVSKSSVPDPELLITVSIKLFIQ